MLKTTELFINELKERDLKYRDIRTLQDGDDLVEVGFNLDSTRIQIMISLMHRKSRWPSDVLR